MLGKLQAIEDKFLDLESKISDPVSLTIKPSGKS